MKYYWNDEGQIVGVEHGYIFYMGSEEFTPLVKVDISGGREVLDDQVR